MDLQWCLGDPAGVAGRRGRALSAPGRTAITGACEAHRFRAPRGLGSSSKALADVGMRTRGTAAPPSLSSRRRARTWGWGLRGAVPA